MLKIISANQWQIELQPILINSTSKVTTTNKVCLPYPVVESPKRQISIQVIESLALILILKTVLEVQVGRGNTVLLGQHKTYLQGTMVTIKMKIKLLINHIEKIDLLICSSLIFLI